MAVPPVLAATVRDGVLADLGPAPSAPWWSVTKTAIAAAALALVDRGRLALDAPLEGRPFTLRQLLQHTAGVPDYGGLAAYHEAVARGDPPWSPAELLERAGAERLLFSPGSGWAYSNIGYLYARLLIETAAGEDLGGALRRWVFAPLGLGGVRLAREPADLSATAWGNARGYHPGWVYHGLLVGTPAEAALFLDGLLAGRLVRGPLLEAMCLARPVEGAVAPGRPWRSPGYGLGLMADPDSPRGRCLGHTGAGPGGSAAVFHFPDADPPRTTAAFAAAEDPRIVEEAVLG